MERVAAARAGGLAKAARGRGEATTPAPGSPTSETGLPPKPFRFWPDYKDFLECELRKLKLVGEQTDNEAKRAKLDQERGRLLTREQVEARDERCDDIILGHLDALVEFAGSLVPPEDGTAAKTKAQAWVAALRKRIADDLRAVR